MTEYDSNLIKPVDSLKNITGISPVKHREERKRRQHLHHENEKNDENTGADETANQAQPRNRRGIKSDGIGIDYCA